MARLNDDHCSYDICQKCFNYYNVICRQCHPSPPIPLDAALEKLRQLDEKEYFKEEVENVSTRK